MSPNLVTDICHNEGLHRRQPVECLLAIHSLYPPARVTEPGNVSACADECCGDATCVGVGWSDPSCSIYDSTDAHTQVGNLVQSPNHDDWYCLLHPAPPLPPTSPPLAPPLPGAPPSPPTACTPYDGWWNADTNFEECQPWCNSQPENEAYTCAHCRCKKCPRCLRPPPPSSPPPSPPPNAPGEAYCADIHKQRKFAAGLTCFQLTVQLNPGEDCDDFWTTAALGEDYVCHRADAFCDSNRVIDSPCTHPPRCTHPRRASRRRARPSCSHHPPPARAGEARSCSTRRGTVACAHRYPRRPRRPTRPRRALPRLHPRPHHPRPGHPRPRHRPHRPPRRRRLHRRPRRPRHHLRRTG